MILIYSKKRKKCAPLYNTQIVYKYMHMTSIINVKSQFCTLNHKLPEKVRAAHNIRYKWGCTRRNGTYDLKDYYRNLSGIYPTIRNSFPSIFWLGMYIKTRGIRTLILGLIIIFVCLWLEMWNGERMLQIDLKLNILVTYSI